MKTIFILVLCLLGTPAFATVFYGPPVTVTATVTSTQELTQNNSRMYLLIQNTGSNPVIVKFGSAQTGVEGITVPAGGNYEPIVAPADSVWMRSSASTSAVTIQQGQ